MNGNLPEIATVYRDRTVAWRRTRITQQMRDYVEALANEPFIAISASQHDNFYTK